MHGPNGQSLSPEDVVKAEALDSPSGLDFSGDTYPVNILCLWLLSSIMATVILLSLNCNVPVL